MKLKIHEKDVIRAVLHYLTLRKVWHRRINSGGAVLNGHSGKGQFVRYGSPGMPDILARGTNGAVIWIECKSSTGRLSDDQRKWKEDMERFGDIFITARSVDDVMALFEPKREVVHA